jgi:hypothetical protein
VTKANAKKKTMSVPEAGRAYFGLKPHAAYAAAKKGRLPIIRMGRRIWVSVPALEKMLERAA